MPAHIDHFADIVITEGRGDLRLLVEPHHRVFVPRKPGIQRFHRQLPLHRELHGLVDAPHAP